MDADAAWDVLNAALRDTVPLCDGQAAFTDGALTSEQLAACAVLCAACPLVGPCGAYATAAGVTAGYWAGHQYTPKGRK